MKFYFDMLNIRLWVYRVSFYDYISVISYLLTGWSPGEGNGNPLQFVGSQKIQTQLSDSTTTNCHEKFHLTRQIHSESLDSDFFGAYLHFPGYHFKITLTWVLKTSPYLYRASLPVWGERKPCVLEYTSFCVSALSNLATGSSLRLGVSEPVG